MEERRRYYRITDEVSLRYHIVNNEDYDEEMQEANIGFIRQTDIHHACHHIDHRLKILTQKLDKTEPLIAEAISLLNKKLSLYELMQENEAVEDLMEATQQSVNLSGSGIAFYAEEAIAEKTAIKLELVIYPETEYLNILGKVVNCRPNIDKQYIVAVDFDHINDDIRELIIQHVIKKQTQELRESAENRE